MRRLPVLAALLATILLAGCGTWHRYVPADDPGSAWICRLTCLDDSLTITVLPVANEMYRSGFSQQFHCLLQVETVGPRPVAVCFERLDLEVEDAAYAAELLLTQRDTGPGTMPLQEYALTLPRRDSMGETATRVEKWCLFDEVLHEGMESAVLSGRVRVTAPGRPDEILPFEVPLAKISERRPHRWTT